MRSAIFRASVADPSGIWQRGMSQWSRPIPIGASTEKSPVDWSAHNSVGDFDGIAKALALMASGFSCAHYDWPKLAYAALKGSLMSDAMASSWFTGVQTDQPVPTRGKVGDRKWRLAS